MADFGYFSDSDDFAVEELLSEVQDLCVLDQISKINCSGFTDSLLPSDLETRFRKLKSFPLSKSNLTSSDIDNHQNSVSVPKTHNSLYSKSERPPSSKIKSVESESDAVRDAEQNPDDDCLETDYWKDLEKERKRGSVSPFSNSSSSRIEAITTSPSKWKCQKKAVSNSKSRSASVSDLPSPQQKTGCFWCSPKKVSKKQNKQDWNLDWEVKDDEEFVSDLNIYSAKEGEKIMKKALKEEAKVKREAEKIVKWAKQISGSSRMSSHNVEDYPSDDDSTT